MSVTRPRDGDGDGFVYDNTPRMRPWNPVTDVAYPDGELPDAVQRRQQKARAVQQPSPRFTNPRGIGAVDPWDRLPYDVALTNAFNVDLGDGYRAEVTSTEETDGGLQLSGGIFGPDGEDVGYFERWVSLGRRLAQFHELHIDAEHRNKGLGSRFYAESIERLRREGVQRVDIDASSRRGRQRRDDSNGAYTWARAGFDWKPGSIHHRHVADAIRSYGDDPALLGVAARLDAVATIPENPGDLPADFPTPNDVALLGWTPGATAWPGRSILLAEGRTDGLGWRGSLHLDPPQLGVDDIGELPNPFAEQLPGGEAGSAVDTPTVESPVKLTTKVNTIAPDFTPEQAEQFARFLTRQTGMSQYASDKYLAMNVRSFVQGYSTREWLDPLFTTDTPDPDAVALVQAWRRNLVEHVTEKGGDGVTLHRGVVDRDTDPFVPMRTDHWSNTYNDVRPQRSDAAIAGITSWTSVKTEAKQFGGHNVSRDIPIDQLIGRFGSIKGEVLVADDPLVTRALDAWPNDVDGVPAAPFGTFPERYGAARGADVPEVDRLPEDLDDLRVKLKRGGDYGSQMRGEGIPSTASRRGPRPDTPTEVTFYEVGGAVRDDLMGIFSDDVDFAVTAPSYEAMKAHLEAEGFRIFQEREEFATIKAKVPDGHPLQARTHVADFVLARRDGPSSDGRRPDYTEPGTLEEDLARRDFTVNAIARDTEGNLIDPFGGQADIESRTLRFVGDPAQRVREDGLRVLRGFRFMVTKQLTPEPETWEALTSDDAAEMLMSVSKERVSNELQKMLDYDTLGAVQLLGQLPTPVLDAIFRDGVRLSPNLGKVKGAQRDPDLPRNPFVAVDNGDVIELGSGPAGWERKPGPDRPIRRDDLPRREVVGWEAPMEQAKVAAAFAKKLPNGYRIEPGGSRREVLASIKAPDGSDAGYFRWNLYEDSPTAYLSFASVDGRLRGQGIGSQVFAANIESLRELGYDTVELTAMSNDDANGAYTWARAGVDWEPGDWELPELAAKLATHARDGNYPEGVQQEAFRIAGLLTTRGANLPYDPAEFPEDLPTPNDVAMIGWTPGATDWLGKNFLSGTDPLDPTRPIAWSGSMRIDDLDLPPNPFAEELDAGDVELGSGETSYLDRVGDMTWDQLQYSRFSKDEYDALSPDGKDTYFDRARAEKREFTRNVAAAISTGEITPEDAIERFNLRDDLTREFGHGNGWQPLPPKLYHVTTAATAVGADGRLRTRTELEMQRATGLGGGTSDAVSFTADGEVAEAIAASIREASDVAAGRKTVQDMLDEAERDGFLADFVGYWRSGWKEGDEYPPIVERMRRNLPWEFDRSVLSTVPRDSEERWSESDAPEEDRLNVYKWFSGIREYATGRLDPLFFGTDAVALANMDASEVAIVEVEPVPGGQGVQMGALGEWRTPTGDAVVITDIVAPASDAVAAAVGRRAARKLLRAPDLGGGGGAYLRSKGLWNDPGSGKFAPIGWSTAKAKELNDRELLNDVIEDALRSHRDGVMVRLGTNKLRSLGGSRNDWLRARLTDHGIEVDVPTGSRPPFTRYVVDVEDLDDVYVQMPDDFRAPTPTEPSFRIDAERVAEAARELGIENVKVWSQGDPLAANEASEQLLAILGGEPAPADWAWDEDLKRWTETRTFSVEGTYRDYRVSVEATAEDTVDGNGVPARGLRYRLRVTGPDNLTWGGTGAEWKVDVDVTEPLGVALRDVRALVDRHAGPRPAGEGVLTAENLDGDGEALRSFLRALDAGPGWEDRSLPPEDHRAIVRFRGKVREYGALIGRGSSPADALHAVQDPGLLDFETLLGEWGERRWDDIIEGRGHLSANLRALRGEEGFGSPDPDAIRFMQLLRADFLAKVPDSPAGAIRLYRATDDPTPWGGNDPTRFGSDKARKPSSGVTSWAFLSADRARSTLSGYGDYLHGEDVPYSQVIGRFGAVGAELLAANDPAIVEAIDNYSFGSARDRALDVLAELPDDPFAAPHPTLSAAERDGIATALDEAITGPAADIKRRFPELSDDDARKLALFGGVPESRDDPWDLTPEWLTRVPWDRVRGFAVEVMWARRSDAGDVTPTARGLGIIEILREQGEYVSMEHGAPFGPFHRDLMSESAALALARVAEDAIKTPPADRLDSELTDADRKRLDAIVGAGRVLLGDLRDTLLSEVDTVADSELAYDPLRAEILRVQSVDATARAETLQTEARGLVERHAEDWISAASPGTPDWPVGPLQWVPIENGLIDVKSPKFDDAEGRRFKLEPRDYDGDNAIDGWVLVQLGVAAPLQPRLHPTTFGAPVEGYRSVEAPTAEETAALGTLTEALGAIESARLAWWEAKEASEELADLDQLTADSLRGRSIHGAEAVTRSDFYMRLQSWASVVANPSDDHAKTLRVNGFTYAPEAFPEADDLNEVRALGDASRDDVVRAIASQSILIGDPVVRAGGIVEVPLDPDDLHRLGWGAGAIRMKPGDDWVDLTLELHRDATATRSRPDLAVTWRDRRMGSVGFLVERLAALDRQRRRYTERERAERTEVMRDWAARTFHATTEPLVDPDGTDPVRAEQLARAVTPFIPDSLKLSSTPVRVRDVEPGSKYGQRSYYRQATDGEPSTTFMAGGAKDSTFLHEYGHHIERLGPVGRAAWAFYQHRTEGDATVPLADLARHSNYRPDEVARPDDFFEFYAGKDYGNGRSRARAGRSELFTIGLEGVFYDKRGNSGEQIDDEYAAFILGLLLHAGDRAERYFPDLTTGDEGDTGSAVPVSVKDLDDLLAERYRERRRRRSHFGRILTDGWRSHGGDNDSPFIIEDELLDRDNQIDTGSPVATPGVELDPPDSYDPPIVRRTPVIDASLSTLRRRHVERVALGREESTPELRAVIEHSQQSLRDQGIETVTLYRGAAEGVDPFDSRSSPLALRSGRSVRRPSGVTSWTTNPAKASNYLGEDGLTMYRAEVPVDQIVSYDAIGIHSKGSSGWQADQPLDGAEVLVAADPAIIDRMLGRNTPDATMEGDAAPAP